VAFWSVREELSQFNRLRRSYYELLRDELDQFMLDYALIQSYHQFVDRKLPYPFIEKGSSSPVRGFPASSTRARRHFWCFLWRTSSRRPTRSTFDFSM
jgi:hypothetical protein